MNWVLGDNGVVFLILNMAKDKQKYRSFSLTGICWLVMAVMILANNEITFRSLFEIRWLGNDSSFGVRACFK